MSTAYSSKKQSVYMVRGMLFSTLTSDIGCLVFVQRVIHVSFYLVSPNHDNAVHSLLDFFDPCPNLNAELQSLIVHTKMSSVLNFNHLSSIQGLSKTPCSLNGYPFILGTPQHLDRQVLSHRVIFPLDVVRVSVFGLTELTDKRSFSSSA